MYYIILGGILLFSMLILLGVLVRFLLRKSFYHAHVKQNLEPRDYNLDSQELFIDTSNNKKVQLYLLGAQNKGALVICIHGWENTVEKFFPISQQLVKYKYRVILLNTRNHGKSDPDGYSSMIQFAEDLNAAISYCRSEFGPELKIFLLGHSLGAATVIYKASKDSGLAGVIAIGSFADLKNVISKSFLAKNMPRLILPLILKYMEWSAGDRFENLSPISIIGRITVPILLMHGDKDKIVPVSAMREISAAASSKKIQTKTISGADHSSLLESSEAAETLLAFLNHENQ